MIYFIYLLGGFILLTLIFIIIVGKYVFDIQIENTYSPFMNFAPPIIERAYRGVDFRYQFQYSTEYPRFYNESLQFIENNEHKQYIIRDAVRKMADNLYESGCIEIEEHEVDYSPTHKQVVMKIKVYKPE